MLFRSYDLLSQEPNLIPDCLKSAKAKTLLNGQVRLKESGNKDQEAEN